MSSCVSCYYGESNAIPSENSVIHQKTFLAPPLPELKFYLVGKGDHGEGCGEIGASYICSNPDCSKPHYTPFRCKRKACPDCYGIWIKDEVNKACARLLSANSLKRNQNYRLVHIILSPEQSSPPVTRAELRALFHEGYEYIKEKGAMGGVVVFHAFRTTQYAKEQARIEHMKKWEWVRQQKRPQDYYFFSPHFHLLTFVKHLKPPKEGEGWIYKTITDKNRHVIDFMRKAKREKEIKRVIGYLLTHAVILEGNEDIIHSIRWFGSCSYNQFLTTEEEINTSKSIIPIPKCKVCGHDLIPFWDWIRTYYGDVIWGGMDPPKYFDEIVDALDGDPPPEDFLRYLVD